MKFTKDQVDEIRRQYGLLVKNPVLKKREHGGEGYTKRDDYHRDYTRILYSSSFRRLQGKMQILGIENTAFFRNRLTHSLEVSQIAHSIAVNIGKECNIYQDDLFVIDAAALAHDIGHPAFGHKGERVLNELANKQHTTFEGNAQNYRVLRVLEKKEPKILGLNLTNRSLLAINKYLITEEEGMKKFMYREDYDYLGEIRFKAGLSRMRTLDAQIIDVADEIAYCVHDLEDGLALRYFSIDELLFLLRKKNPDFYLIFLRLVNNARNYASAANSYGTIQEYSQVFRKRLTSVLTDKFIKDITLGPVSKKESKEHGTNDGLQELQLDKYKGLCNTLKDIIFECVTRDTYISIYENKGEQVLKGLYNIYTDESINKDGILLPPDYRPRVNYTLHMGTIDYLAGMMDAFAISQYEELCGTEFSKIKIKG